LKSSVYINAFGMNCALGHDRATVASRLFAGDVSGMRLQTGWVPANAVMVGAVTATLPDIPATEAIFASRNNRVLLQAAQQIEAALHTAVERFGAHRIGVVLGTSTTGIAETERFLAGQSLTNDDTHPYCYHMQEQGSPAQFLARHWQLTGPAWVVSTACSSSARAMIAAKRLLDLDLCDAVVSGGADTLCKLTLNGFSALEAVSATRCDPFSAQRNGINIGEGAGVFLLSRTPDLSGAPVARLCGGGISMDAYHMSAPDPDGKGAIRAMQGALQEAGLVPADIDYVNLHGTATRQNDAMEATAMHDVFSEGVACSSTKPMTGHALGAASAIEAGICLLALSPDNRENLLPPHIWSGAADPALPILALTAVGQSLRSNARGYMMSNSFAFGGNNVSLVFGRA
jgi:3-oxoacyl-[acyl-carrier-protein] synthase-1